MIVLSVNETLQLQSLPLTILKSPITAQESRSISIPRIAWGYNFKGSLVG